jgi:hypothetical protein
MYQFMLVIVLVLLISGCVCYRSFPCYSPLVRYLSDRAGEMFQLNLGQVNAFLHLFTVVPRKSQPTCREMTMRCGRCLSDFDCLKQKANSNTGQFRTRTNLMVVQIHEALELLVEERGQWIDR